MGMIILAVWLILQGIATFVPQLAASPMNIVLGVMAIVAGILILVGK